MCHGNYYSDLSISTDDVGAVCAQAQEHDMKSGGQKGLWKKGGKKPFSRRN